MWRFARTVLLFLLANHAVAAEFCPDKNPADTDDADEIDEQARRQYVLCKCGTWQPNGDYTLSNAESIRRCTILINNDFLAKYDDNCSLEFDAGEKARYMADQEGMSKKTFHAAVTRTDADTVFYQRQDGRRCLPAHWRTREGSGN